MNELEEIVNGFNDIIEALNSLNPSLRQAFKTIDDILKQITALILDVKREEINLASYSMHIQHYFFQLLLPIVQAYNKIPEKFRSTRAEDNGKYITLEEPSSKIKFYINSKKDRDSKKPSYIEDLINNIDKFICALETIRDDMQKYLEHLINKVEALKILCQALGLKPEPIKEFVEEKLS